MEAALQHEGAGARDLRRAGLVRILHAEVDPARIAPGFVRPARQVAGERVHQRIGQEIDAALADLVRAAGADDLDQPEQPARAVALLQPADLGFDGGVGLFLDDADRAPVDEAEQAADRQHEHRHVDDRIAEGRGAEELTLEHAGNTPRRARSAASAFRNPCRASGGGG